MKVFEIVVVAVCVASAVIAVAAFARASRLYDRIGRLGGFWISDEDEPSASRPELAGEDVRQLREAIAAARQRRAIAAARGRSPSPRESRASGD